ncbi:MAG: aldo/keto reductase [Planctomycetales bacterium]|nr:aldo/keto reductase [Planctomycetales bacterium]
MSSDDNAPVSQICLGTAQIGLSYGIANRNGRMSDAGCHALLERALEHDITRWDTAPAYGDAEQRLGGFLRSHRRRDDVQIVSKLPAMPTNMSLDEFGRWATQTLDASRRDLGVERLAAWLVHDPHLPKLLGNVLWDLLAAQLDRGAVERVGVSIYDLDDWGQAIASPVTTAIQLPLSLLDQRFAAPPVSSTCTDRTLDVYARSVLLQGLLTLSPKDLPPYFAPWRADVQRLHDWLNRRGWTPTTAAIPFALAQPHVRWVVIGVDNVEQLDHNLTMCARRWPVDWNAEFRKLFGGLDVTLLEPRRWRFESQS